MTIQYDHHLQTFSTSTKIKKKCRIIKSKLITEKKKEKKLFSLS